MNNEIKEILDNIKNKYEDYYVQDIVSGNDLKQLLDYITNLQQELEEEKRIEEADLHKIQSLEEENKRLKERVAYLERSNNRREDTIIGLRFEVAEQEDYKSRCEKAYEELTYMSSSDYVKDYDIKQNCWIKLSNILQNGSEDNEC